MPLEPVHTASQYPGVSQPDTATPQQPLLSAHRLLPTSLPSSGSAPNGNQTLMPLGSIRATSGMRVEGQHPDTSAMMKSVCEPIDPTKGFLTQHCLITHQCFRDWDNSVTVPTA